MRFNYEFLGGQVSNNFQISHVLDSSVDGGRDTAGEAGLPSHRAILNNTYSYGDWNVAWNINYIDSQSANSTYDAAPSWTTHDLQFNYNAPWDGKFTVGARNLFEKYPPIGLGAIGDRDYDYYLYDGFGRVTYFRYTQTF
jgi:iron complex outermembrane receptor protein